ncbi:MAG: peptide chain release factor N(5)-glutamine methyltransferase [Gammaproteobacteria bacterium]|nr:peptide chain release factor N(5)-glutamine methyltransferase [Gammaproteobacteria bacterium]
MSYADLIQRAKQQLYDSSETPRIDAEVLLQHVLNKPLAWLLTHGDQIAEPEHLVDFNALIARRQTGEPIAYLTGVREFWSLELAVSPAVLIPRPDTEVLVEQALVLLPADRAIKVLDLGTGSGAIALALAKERPLATVTAVDSSMAALDIARLNATTAQLKNIEFIKSDWFSALEGQRFNLIAANPPYVAEGDPHLGRGDLRFEPDLALASGADGLQALRHIIEQAPNHLEDNGALLVEHGYDQEDAVARLMDQQGLSRKRCFRDLNDLPRCSLALI